MQAQLKVATSLRLNDGRRETPFGMLTTISFRPHEHELVRVVSWAFDHSEPL